MTDIEYQRMNLPKRFWNAKWDSIGTEWQEIIKKYVNEVFDAKTGKGLLLYGEGGTGKTFIAAVIAKGLRKKEFQIYYLPASEISNQGLRKIFDDTSVHDRALAVDLLIVDDLNIATDKVPLYSILKYRSDNMLSTIITTRVRVQDLPIVAGSGGKKKFGFKEYFDKFYGDLSPVVQGNMLPVFISGENYREKELTEYAKIMFNDNKL